MSTLKSIGRRFRRSEAGTTAVEFAIVANFFVLLLLGLFGAGYAFMIKSDMNRSLAAAERYALVYDEDNTALETLIKGKLTAYDKSALTLSFDRGSSGGVNYVKVVATYAIDLGLSFILKPVTLTSTRIFPT